MSVDFTSRAPDAAPNSPEEPAFAPIPIYARTNRKRPKRAAATMTSSEAGESERAAPAWSRIPPLAVGVGLAVIAAGAAFYAMQPRDSGMAALTPGEPAAEAPLVAAQAPIDAAPTVPTPVAPRVETMPTAEPRAAAPAPERRVVARARPAASAAGASESGTDASATLPASPQPYAGAAQTPAAASPPAPIAPPAAAVEPVNPAPSMNDPETAPMLTPESSATTPPPATATP